MQAVERWTTSRTGGLVLLSIAVGSSAASSPCVVVGAVARDTPGVIETDIRPKKAEVWIDGELVGEARDFNGRWDRLWVAPGEHVLEFRRSGYRRLRVFIDLEPAGYVQIVDELEPGSGPDPRSTEGPAATNGSRRGSLHFDILPADAAVYLDGAFLGQGHELARLHEAVWVPEGTHRIEVVRPGYGGQSRDVDAREGEPVKVQIELLLGDGD